MEEIEGIKVENLALMVRKLKRLERSIEREQEQGSKACEAAKTPEAKEAAQRQMMAMINYLKQKTADDLLLIVWNEE